MKPSGAFLQLPPLLPCGDLAVLVPIVVYRQYPGASAHICKLQVYQARQGLMSQVQNQIGKRRVDTDHPLHLAHRVVSDDHLGQDLVPGAIRDPQPQPLVRGLAGPVALGQVTL